MNHSLKVQGWSGKASLTVSGTSASPTFIDFANEGDVFNCVSTKKSIISRLSLAGKVCAIAEDGVTPVVHFVKVIACTNAGTMYCHHFDERMGRYFTDKFINRDIVSIYVVESKYFDAKKGYTLN